MRSSILAITAPEEEDQTGAMEEVEIEVEVEVDVVEEDKKSEVSVILPAVSLTFLLRLLLLFVNLLVRLSVMAVP